MNLLQETSDRLKELATIYGGFVGSMSFELPNDVAESIAKFTDKRREISNWSDKNCMEYVISKKVDYVLVNHAISRGYGARLNVELISKDPSFDFDVDSLAFERVTRVESKHMPSTVKHEITIREPFFKNEACLKWKSYDVFLGWRWCDLYNTKFKPWVITHNSFLSSQAWDEFWDDNDRDHQNRGGKNLKIDNLPPEIRKGAILL